MLAFEEISHEEPLTLEEIAKKEPLILLDTSGLEPDRDNCPELEMRMLIDIINKIKGNLPLFIMPETIKEVINFVAVSKRGLRKHKRMYKKNFAHFKLHNDAQIFMNEKHRVVKRLIDQLKTIELSLKDNPIYLPFQRIMYCLEDKLKIKGKDGNPNNRTDEVNIAAALYFSTFGSGAALVSRDEHFYKLLKCAIRELQNPDLTLFNQKVLEPLCKTGIRIYYPVNINQYKTRLDTAQFSINQNPRLEKNDVLYLKLQLKLINSPV